MITEATDGCTFREKEIDVPSDFWTRTKLEHSNERCDCQQARVIRVEFRRSNDERVLVRTRSNEEGRLNDATLR
jgi:hypothetical protein